MVGDDEARSGRGQEMILAEPEQTGLDADLAAFTSLADDRRTATPLDETIRGILGRERLICSRIVAFSPSAGIVTA